MATATARSPGQDNPHLLVSLNNPPTYSGGDPRKVYGVEMLDDHLYVVYDDYNKVEVFDCEDCFKKVKDIAVEGMRDPTDMVGCNVAQQLFICEWYGGVIWRVDLKTQVSDVFVKLGNHIAGLSLARNRLLVTSFDAILVYVIHSGDRVMKIAHKRNMVETGVLHAVESNRGSLLLCHGFLANSIVSEIDSDGRVIRVFNNNEQFECVHLALDSVGRLLVADRKNCQVVLLDKRLKYERIVIDKQHVDNSHPWTLKYDQKKNRLAVGFNNGQVKIFECNVF